MEVHSWNQMVDAILLRKVAFVIAFFVVFLSTYAVLAWFDFLPELVTKDETLENIETKDVILDSASTINPVVAPVETSTTLVQEEVVAAVLPLSMRIEALDKTITVLNPTSREVSDLDEALLSGAVRHPDSATLEQSGTVFILGHSSYLPVVRNKNFQAFNGIQNLKWGDLITITAADGEYVYKVDKVYRAKAADVTVPIAGPSKRLFLATCNSFGSTDDRYIAEAELIEVRLF